MDRRRRLAAYDPELRRRASSFPPLSAPRPLGPLVIGPGRGCSIAWHAARSSDTLVSIKLMWENQLLFCELLQVNLPTLKYIYSTNRL